MKVKSGLEILLEKKLDLISGRRIGVIAHPASIDSNYSHIVDLLHHHPSVQLAAVFGPQHGARGETQDNMIEWQGFRDERTGLPVYSLYGEHRKPTPEMLSGLDLLLFDLQDVGARYYTFIYTMALSMEACREVGIDFVVLDRPNPINGVDIEGPVLDPSYRSFVGLYPLPVRHGMTVGELALYFNQEMGIGCRLQVVQMQGWDRHHYFDQTGLPWILPSPNIPTLDSALVYPGLCLLEGTNVSEGRGTTRPFEFSGAPWIDPYRLVEELSLLDLPGVHFRPVHFIPTFHKWAGKLIGGVQIHVVDRNSYRPFRTGLALVSLYRKLRDGQFRWNDAPYEYEYQLLPFDILCGTNRIREQIEAGLPPDEIENAWRSDLDSFLQTRRQCLLY